MTVGHYAKRQGGMEALSDTFIAETFILIGGLLLLGLLTDVLGRYTFLPRVTLLLLFGFLIGPVMLDVLPAPRVSWEPFKGGQGNHRLVMPERDGLRTSVMQSKRRSKSVCPTCQKAGPRQGRRRHR